VWGEIEKERERKVTKAVLMFSFVFEYRIAYVFRSY
jgi:hypothetical protein